MKKALFASVLVLAIASCRKNRDSDGHHVRYEVLPSQPGEKASLISYTRGDGTQVTIASSNNQDSIPLPWSAEVDFPGGQSEYTVYFEEHYQRSGVTTGLDTRRIYVDGVLEAEAFGYGSMEFGF
ncbi:MAG: hypothetical protein EOO15_12760 [Chitinophagaceae bacterium]|nr:MAG: hypothetical protein EOO15_12760 [Chitinophagaceae bacterium]